MCPCRCYLTHPTIRPSPDHRQTLLPAWTTAIQRHHTAHHYTKSNLKLNRRIKAYSGAEKDCYKGDKGVAGYLHVEEGTE